MKYSIARSETTPEARSKKDVFTPRLSSQSCGRPPTRAPAPFRKTGPAQKSAPRMNATVWLDVSCDAVIATESSAAPRNQYPMKVPIMTPMSGRPRKSSTTTFVSEKSSATV